MASIKYLWRNRAVFEVASRAFYRAWAKRLFTLPELLKRNRRRKELCRKGARIDSLAEIGEVIISGNKRNLQIGKFSFLGRVNIALHEEVVIGDNVCINDGVEIITASHDVQDPYWRHIKKKVVVGDYVWIGTGAMILPGVILGSGCVIGAKAVVTKSVEPYSIVAGNPAKSLIKTRVNELSYNPCEFVAANRAWLVG